MKTAFAVLEMATNSSLISKSGSPTACCALQSIALFAVAATLIGRQTVLLWRYANV